MSKMNIRAVTSINWSKLDALLADAVVDPNIGLGADSKKTVVFPGAVLQIGWPPSPPPRSL